MLALKLEMGLSLLPRVKVHRDNDDLKLLGLPLTAPKEPFCFSCAMGCASTPGLFNALFDSALGRGDKGRKK